MTRRPPGDAEMTICFNVWAPNPIFHEWAEFQRGRGAITHCGRPIDTNTYSTSRMRRDHAQRIGRPCQPCLKKGMTWRFRFTTTHQNWSTA